MSCSFSQLADWGKNQNACLFVSDCFETGSFRLCLVKPLLSFGFVLFSFGEVLLVYVFHFFVFFFFLKHLIKMTAFCVEMAGEANVINLVNR